MILEMYAIEQRVAKGAAFLDQHIPDWRTRINWDEFDLFNSEKCIFGQIYGGYNYGTLTLEQESGIDYIDGAAHGFDVHMSDAVPENQENFNRVWKRFAQQ